MFRMILKISFFSAIGILFAALYAKGDELNVFVSIPPQKYFVEKIAGDRVNIHIMVPSREIPHRYEPDPETFRKLANAHAYFSIGMTFERMWMKRVEPENPDMLVIDISYGIEKRPTPDIDMYPEQYPHLAIDPHIWVSPPLVMIQARNILTGLIKIDPEGRQDFEANYISFMQEIIELDIELRNRLIPGTAFMVYHPAWGYFAEAYGLRQVTLAIEGEALTTPQIRTIIEQAKERDIRIIMTQPQVPSPEAQRIAHEIGGQVVIVDPLAENWDENLLNVADILTRHEGLL
jgi:zinc transport system substrate-binding protein